jgi:hypothetical protein
VTCTTEPLNHKALKLTVTRWSGDVTCQNPIARLISVPIENDFNPSPSDFDQALDTVNLV